MIAKIASQKEAHAEAKKMIEAASKKFTMIPGSKEAAIRKAKKDAASYIKDLVLTERDKAMLAVVGLDDKNIDQLGGLALTGINAWNASKGNLRHIDNTILNGGVSNLLSAVNVYGYAAAAKNSYNQSKFKVEWEPKSAQRACAVCNMVFKQMTLRKTHSKHHCRICGKVVCHVCAANRIYMPVSDKFERVCTHCLTNHEKTVLLSPISCLFSSKLPYMYSYLSFWQTVLRSLLTHYTMHLQLSHVCMYMLQGGTAAAKPIGDGENHDDDSSDDSGGEK